MSLLVYRRIAGYLLAIERAEFYSDLLGDIQRHLALKAKNVVYISLVALRPNAPVSRRINELDRYSDALSYS